MDDCERQTERQRASARQQRVFGRELEWPLRGAKDAHRAFDLGLDVVLQLAELVFEIQLRLVESRALNPLPRSSSTSLL